MSQADFPFPDCLSSCPLAPTLVMMRREAFYAMDHWSDPDIDRAEDTDFFVRLILSGCRMA